MANLLKIIIKELLKNKAKSPTDLRRVKGVFSKKFNSPFPKNIDLLKAYHKLTKEKTIKKSLILENLLKTRPIRSISGIVNISVLTKPFPCPGKCIFCPVEKGIPKSYVSGEPAVERAKTLKFNPYLQTKKRIEALEFSGHSAEKIELRIVGGTWSYYPKKYQEWFIVNSFAACNLKPFISIKKITQKTLEKEQRINEKSKYKIVGISIETRPDFINISEIKQLRKLGITLVELGVQSIYNKVLKLNSRNHDIKKTILATKILKEFGFKVLYQMMPNLFGSTPRKDEKMFKELFKNPCFQPDLLKIYPCAILKKTALYGLWKKKKYKPYSQKELINIIKKIKKIIPYYVRIQRIIRDIPSSKILEGGTKISNLRQLLANQAEKNNFKCKCIRCREVKEKYDPKEKSFLLRQDYNASEGKEIFLTFENKNRSKLFSMLRLRIPSEKENQSLQIFPILKKSGIIREIHSYGPVVSIDKKRSANHPSAQHQGFGKKLIKEAERITKKEFKLEKISVISAIGTRNYFRKLGYKLKETYMVKKL